MRERPARVWLLLLIGLLAAGAVGCGLPGKTAEDRALVRSLDGRWRGEPFEAPADAWWEGTRWDLKLSPAGVMTVVVLSYEGGRVEERRLTSRYVVDDGALVVREDDAAGVWQLEREAPETLRMERADGLRLRLHRVYGS